MNSAGDRGPKVTLYTQVFCGYCSAARNLLKSKGVDFEDIDVTLKANRRSEMIQRSGRRTVPQIFVGDEHIGGYDDLAALDRDGRLDKLLGITG
ncbi:MAG: glutaredoxin 3 [Gammaproteobacteria bacterium]